MTFALNNFSENKKARYHKALEYLQMRNYKTQGQERL